MVIGCRLDPIQVAYDWAGFGRIARKIMVDIDEHEINKISPPIDVPIVEDAGRILAEVAVRAKETGGLSDAMAADRQRWLERCRQWKGKYPIVEGRHRRLPEGVSTYVLAEELSPRLSASDTVVIGSSGAAIEAFMLAYSAPLGQRAFLTGAWVRWVSACQPQSAHALQPEGTERSSLTATADFS